MELPPWTGEPDPSGPTVRFSFRLGRVMDMATQPATDSCLGCQGPLQSLGVEHFRVGGVSGGWAALMGQ